LFVARAAIFVVVVVQQQQRVLGGEVRVEEQQRWEQRWLVRGVMMRAVVEGFV
jgi:hypothetical protein